MKRVKGLERKKERVSTENEIVERMRKDEERRREERRREERRGEEEGLGREETRRGHGREGGR